MKSTLSPLADLTAGSSAAVSSHVLAQLAGGALLGMVMLYGVAFSESPTLHNAAHDVRHVTVKPCH